jgi:hypothetical protein
MDIRFDKNTKCMHGKILKNTNTHMLRVRQLAQRAPQPDRLVSQAWVTAPKGAARLLETM